MLNENLIYILKMDLMLYGQCYYNKETQERVHPTLIRYSNKKGYYKIEGTEQEFLIDDIIEFNAE